MANKLFFMTECKALKLPVPEFHVIENPHELKQLQVVYYFHKIYLFCDYIENNFDDCPFDLQNEFLSIQK